MKNQTVVTTKPSVPPAAVVKGVNLVRNKMIKATQKMVPPPVALLDMVGGMWTAQAVGVLARLGIADHMEPVISVDDLAKRAGVNADALYRVLRAVSTVDVCIERPNRKFELTAIGKCLRTDHPQSMRHMLIFQTGFNWAHWGAIDHAVKTGTNAVEEVRGVKPFDWLSQNPKDAEVFDRAMVNISKMEINAVLASYNFGRFKTIADIGGGYGAFLASILHLYQNCKGILFDMPHVTKGAEEFILKEGLSKRVSIEGGSFFDSIPSGADAYMMKHIIHDWSDDHSVKILKNIRSKMEPTATLLLFEAVVPEPNDPHFSKFLDLEMLVVTEGGRERTKQEFENLLAKAGFRLQAITSTIALSQVIEARPV